MTDDEKIVKDAERYRKLRGFALNGGNLEAYVAINQLDYILDSDKFDTTVDNILSIFRT